MIETARSLRRVVRNLCQYGSEGSAECEDVGSVNRSAGLAAGDVARVSAMGNHAAVSHVVNVGACIAAGNMHGNWQRINALRGCSYLHALLHLCLSEMQQMQESLGLAYHVLWHMEMGLWRSGDTGAAYHGLLHAFL